MRQESLQKPNDNKQNKKQLNRSFSDIAILRSVASINQKLKKQIGSKFNKHSRHDETNLSTLSNHKKSSVSLLAQNLLAKSSFSMNDTITHKSSLREITQPKRQTAESILSNRKKINSSYRERYNSSIDGLFFRTRADIHQQSEIQPVLKQTVSARQIISRKPSVDYSVKTAIQKRNQKFKLLFKQKTIKLKTASQRKIVKIDSKIEVLKNKKTYLQSLMPRDKPKVVVNKVKPRGEIIKKEKIMSLAMSLIKYLQLYFNMYQHNNIVGGHIKNIQGYSARLKTILMIDNNRAKRITNFQEITNHFWSFQPEHSRPQYFGQQDLALYNILNGYLLKIEKRYSDHLAKFNYFQQQRKRQDKDSLKKAHEKYQKKLGRHEQVNKINQFIENRLRYDQGRREQYMVGLQKRGVKLNLIQRSRQLILREKQAVMKRTIRSSSFK